MLRTCRSALKADIVAHLVGRGPLPCSEIAAAVSRDWCVANRTLHRLLRDGKVRKLGRHKHVVWEIVT